MDSIIEFIFGEMAELGELSSNREAKATANQFDILLDKSVKDRETAIKLSNMACDMKSEDMRQGFKKGFQTAFKLFCEAMNTER